MRSNDGEKLSKRPKIEDSDSFEEQSEIIETTASQAVQIQPMINTQNDLEPKQTISQLIEKQKDEKYQKLNLSSLISQMVQQEAIDEGKQSHSDIDIFKKKHYLNIDLLQNRGTPHLLRNKTSDKFMRRDVQFYGLYVQKESGEELAKLKDNQLPLDIGADVYYEDFEVENFNHLFWNQQLIEDKFGKSIKIELSVGGNKTLTRKVTEHIDLVRVKDRNDLSPQKSPDGKRRDEQQNDPELIQLDLQLKALEKEFGKPTIEIAEIFCKVSGRLNKMRDFLENKASVVEWGYLEDLALTKQEDSAEFQLLLQTKGWEEIKVRREFLQATPVLEEVEDEQHNQ